LQEHLGGAFDFYLQSTAFSGSSSPFVTYCSVQNRKRQQFFH
jgi:hypothetical protein